MSNAPDNLLIEKAQRGDRDAMNTLVTRYQTRAFQYAYRLTRDNDTASDLVAEAFVRAYTAIVRFRGQSQFSTWLFRIITNCFLDLHKKEKGRQMASIDDEEAGLESILVSEEESPEEASGKAEMGRIMMEAVHKLPEYQRAMIVMYHVENLSYEDMASVLEMPIGTVKSRLNRARQALRRLLEPYEDLFRAG